MQQAISEIYDSIENNKTEKALDLLSQHYPQHQKIATVLKGKYFALKKSELIGTEDIEKVNRGYGKINMAVLELMDTPDLEGEHKTDAKESGGMLTKIITHQVHFIRESIKGFSRSKLILYGVVAIILMIGITVVVRLQALMPTFEGKLVLSATIVLFLITVISFIMLLGNHVKSLRYNKSTLRLFENSETPNS